MSEDASALRRLLDVVGQLGAERRSEQVLRSILDGARDLAGARYAAVGVPTVTAGLRCSSPLGWTPRPGTGSARCRGPMACSAHC